ncbi:RNA polymerase sigma factor SigM [Mycobacterium sp. NPDC050041]|uniref:RNA polymerase sigma factor SigM n=1 Tax=Mycobacterium sp. NPDC050041 TaxID=3364293 RepID=UPI003C2B021B
MESFGGTSEPPAVTDCQSDAELLAAHVAGDRYAFEVLFLRHERQLYRLALVTSRNPEDAADALQDAMLKAHRSAHAFRFDSAVSSWLYRIVVNACLDRLRRNKNHPTTALLDDAVPASDSTARVDTAIVVERALLALPVEQRAAIVAVDMQGYSVAETARMLGVPEGTVKSRCSRARAKLAEALHYFDGAAESRREPRAGRRIAGTHDGDWVADRPVVRRRNDRGGDAGRGAHGRRAGRRPDHA